MIPKCECIRCRPELNLCWDWCFVEASYIDENGDLVE